VAQYAFVFPSKAAVLLNALKTFNDRRYLSIFLFGISSGFPLIMIGSVLSAWLKDEGLSRSAIGLFGIIFATYSFNFLWSPLVKHLVFDRVWIEHVSVCIR
jgi:PAT family beta-lactamase induction signal transducer AmpG